MFFILELVPYVNWRKKWRKSAFAHTLYSISGLKDSGNIAGVRDASPRFLKGVAKVEEKEQDWRRQVGTDAILMREAF